MAEKEDWVFDSIVQFLRGPVWNVPVLTFIEQKSLIFEPDENDNNDEECKKNFSEYKNLVDFMLSSYMEDLGVSQGQFENACGIKTAGKIKSKFHYGLFEQIWAANDYEIFKRMMIQKNIELQLQALELLQQKHGVIPKSFQPKKKGEADEGAASVEEMEDKVMQEVLKKSAEEHKQLQEEKREMETEMVKVSMDEQKRLQALKEDQQSKLVEHFKNEVKIQDPTAIEGYVKPEENKQQEPEPKQEIDPDEIRRRSEFLKEQRDKLLKMKKDEREKQLAAAEKDKSGPARPKSSRAARTVLKGSNNPADVDAKMLQMRKALAEKLKKEVIGDY